MSRSGEARALMFLGLCMRAGRVVSGQEACVAAVRNGESALALLDEGASGNTVKRLKDACASHGVPLFRIGEGELGRAIGKPGRMVVSLPAGGMADKLLALLEEE